MRTVTSLTVFAFLLSSSLAAEETLPRIISVTGQGTAAAPPNMASIQTGVTVTSKTAREALAANNAAMENVMKVLKAKNIDGKDIQTSGFNVYPQYDRNNRGQSRTNTIVGYQVTNQVQVRVRNLSRLGEILDALVQAGSNQISGISFSIDKPTAITNEARKNAVDDARGRAQLYADATGTKVGQVISISEQAVVSPRPQYMARAMMAEAGDSVPVATGEQEVSASIHIVYQLVD